MLKEHDSSAYLQRDAIRRSLFYTVLSVSVSMSDTLTIKARSDRARTRVDAAYLQVMYAYSSRCQLHHFQLRHCIVNDVISTGVVWWSLARTFWPFIVIRSPIAYV